MKGWVAAAFAVLVVSAPMTAQAQDGSVRALLRIPAGCYPVGIDAASERIAQVCRGQAGWTPDGLQFFNQLWAAPRYTNRRTGTSTSLNEDLRNQVGPVPWFENYYLPELDRLNIPRPR